MALSNPIRSSIRMKLDGIASELEDSLLAVDSPEMSDETIYILTSMLVNVDSKDLLALSRDLNMLSEVCPDLSLDVSIANATVLWAFTQCSEDESSADVLSKVEETIGHRPEVLSTLQSCLSHRKKPKEWRSILDTLVGALLRNVLSIVRRQTGETEEEEEEDIEDEIAMETRGMSIKKSTEQESDNEEQPMTNSGLSTSESEEVNNADDEGVNISQSGGGSEYENSEKEEEESLEEMVVHEETDTIGHDEEEGEGGATGRNLEESIASLSQRLKGFSPVKRPPLPLSECEDVDTDDSFNKVDLGEHYFKLHPHKQNNKRGMWDVELTQKLVDGVNRLGVGKWMPILMLADYPSHFDNNTLRHKWKNLLMYNHVQRKGNQWVLK